MNKEILSELFSFHRAQRLGLSIIALILVIGLTLLIILPRFVKRDFNEVTLPIITFEDEKRDQFQSKPQETRLKKSSHYSVNLKPFSFDPNKIDANALVKMGFSSKQANSIIKYRTAIGGFKSVDDLKASYVITDQAFEQLKPYAKINQPPPLSKKVVDIPKKTYPNKQDFVVEVNSADTNKLKTLYGIGSKLAIRIVKYRELLGGFYSKSQLLEVYGIDEERMIGFEPMIKLDSNAISTIDVQTASFKQLIRHPYIDKELTIKILNYRDEHFSMDLLKMQEELQLPDKLVPYIK